METYPHAVLTVVALFFFGLISPGPNFLVVIEATLNFGRVAGVLTGLGAATGDAVYASLGLFGVARLIVIGGRTMMTIELLGGLYLVWLGTRMLMRRAVAGELRGSMSMPCMPARKHFYQGLATDLANPKTVVFFASIFALTISPETPRTVRGAMLLGIVLTSILWRFFLSVIFSIPLIRRVYWRIEQVIGRVFGMALCVFGLLLVKRAV